jgi:hypothetical protein
MRAMSLTVLLDAHAHLAPHHETESAHHAFRLMLDSLRVEEQMDALFE